MSDLLEQMKAKLVKAKPKKVNKPTLLFNLKELNLFKVFPPQIVLSTSGIVL